MIPATKNDINCLANYKDKFVFLIQKKYCARFSLADEKCETFSSLYNGDIASACSLGDRVYVFGDGKMTSNLMISILHNPDAPTVSQEMHWQVIEIPQDVLSSRYHVAFVPLN